MSWSKTEMAEEIIKLFPEGCSINLGIGMPTTIAELIPLNLNCYIHSENGVLGVSGRPKKEEVSPTLINAGKETVSIKEGASFFNSALSFGMIRGGHIDVCVLGGMQVDSEGSLANWMVPGKLIKGMGGAMDLVHGAKQTIVMMSHFTKKGEAKLVKKCTLPLTGKSVIDIVVTELGSFLISDGKFKIKNLANGVSKEDLKMEEPLY